MSREEGERQWQVRQRRANPALDHLTPLADLVARPGCPQRGELLDPCVDCGAYSWARYGAHVVCLGCARRRLRTPESHRDKCERERCLSSEDRVGARAC